MRYVLQVHGPSAGRPVARHRPGLIGDFALCAEDTATTLLPAPGGVRILDGPAAGCAALQRVCIADLRDLDEALRAAERLAPAGAAVEIWPVRRK